MLSYLLVYSIFMFFFLFYFFFYFFFFFFSSRRRHTRSLRDWSSDVCSSDLLADRVGSPPRSASCSSCADTTRVLPRSTRSEERRVGKSVDLGGRRIIKKKNNEEHQ